MIALSIAMICLTALTWQWRTHCHEEIKAWDENTLAGFMQRLQALEESKSTQYDHKAFEDLKSKVDALRISQGLKGSRG